MNKDDTNPYGFPAVVKKKSKKTFVLLMFFGLIIIIMGIYLWFNIPRGEDRSVIELRNVERKTDNIKLTESKIRKNQISRIT